MGFYKKKFLLLTSLAMVVGTFAVSGIKNTSEVKAAEEVYSGDFTQQEGASGSYSANVNVKLSEQTWVASYCYYGSGEFRLGHNKNTGLVPSKYIELTPQGAALEMTWDILGVTEFSITSTKTYGTVSSIILFQSLDSGDTYTEVARSDAIGTLTYTPEKRVDVNSRYSIVVSGTSSPRVVLTDVEIKYNPVTSYTVTYNANEGISETPSEVVNVGESVALPNATREGYTLLGWSESIDGDLVGEVGSEYTPLDDVTLYAIWRSNLVTIEEVFTETETMMNLGFSYTYSPTIYNHITSVNDLNVGDVVLLSNYEGAYVMGPVSGNYMGSINYDENILNEVAAYEIKEGSVEGSLAFYNTVENKYLNCNSEKVVSLVEELSNSSSWKLTDTDNGIQVQSVGSTNLYLKYNASSPRFTTYKSGQQNLSFYVNISGGKNEYNSFNSLVLKFKYDFDFSNFDTTSVASGLIVTTNTDFVNTWASLAGTNDAEEQKLALELLKEEQEYKVLENTSLKDSFLAGITVLDEQLTEMKNTKLYVVGYISTDSGVTFNVSKTYSLVDMLNVYAVSEETVSYDSGTVVAVSDLATSFLAELGE